MAMFVPATDENSSMATTDVEDMPVCTAGPNSILSSVWVKFLFL
jgi:hypothetical protein